MRLVNGTMSAPDGTTDPTLYVEVAVVPLNDGGQGRVLLFCRQQDRARTAELFDRVVESLGS